MTTTGFFVLAGLVLLGILLTDLLSGVRAIPQHPHRHRREAF